MPLLPLHTVRRRCDWSVPSRAKPQEPWYDQPLGRLMSCGLYELLMRTLMKRQTWYICTTGPANRPIPSSPLRWVLSRERQAKGFAGQEQVRRASVSVRRRNNQGPGYQLFFHLNNTSKVAPQRQWQQYFSKSITSKRHVITRQMPGASCRLWRRILRDYAPHPPLISTSRQALAA
jgi:hypothetical protein